ncbi:hypothetical protein EAI_11752 [Harpegnathos saltator]|uniref:Uncharacterized protein n=1 Tax=Harpegnathos saltator TaxID=610380 RepID=E2C2I9_HARSA|nr:hypothetical protein EAI_11752 [Harpegnathos saltator]
MYSCEMKLLAVALLALTSLASAKPAFLPLPLTYASLTPSGQIAGNNGGPLDVQEVGRQQQQQQQQQQRVLDDGRTNLAADESPRSQLQATLRSRQSTLTSPAPLGADGRVVDTAEVAAAKAAHAAAHVNERLNLANEAARSGAAGGSDSSEVPDDSLIAADADARIPEAGNINLASEVVRAGDAFTRIVDGGGAVVPLMLSNGVVVTALLPVESEGRFPADSQEVAGIGNRLNVVQNDVKTVDALAVAGPALAYGRLVY